MTFFTCDSFHNFQDSVRRHNKEHLKAATFINNSLILVLALYSHNHNKTIES